MQPERVSRVWLRPASLWQSALTPNRCALPRPLRQTSWVRGIVRGQPSVQSQAGGNLQIAVILRSGKVGSASRSGCSSVRPELPYYPGIPVPWEYSIQGWVERFSHNIAVEEQKRNPTLTPSPSPTLSSASPRLPSLLNKAPASQKCESWNASIPPAHEQAHASPGCSVYTLRDASNPLHLVSNAPSSGAARPPAPLSAGVSLC